MIYEDISCSNCKKIFTPRAKNVKYCSKECNRQKVYEKKKPLEKNCKNCNNLFLSKNNSKFCSSKCSTKNWQKNNKEKYKKSKKEGENKRKLNNPEKYYTERRKNARKNQKWSHMKREYNLTKEEYFLMLESQNNKCKICNNIFETSVKTHIDHDHFTGKVRGILCQKCNHGLGMFNDNIQLFYNAIHYLEQSK